MLDSNKSQKIKETALYKPSKSSGRCQKLQPPATSNIRKEIQRNDVVTANKAEHVNKCDSGYGNSSGMATNVTHGMPTSKAQGTSASAEQCSINLINTTLPLGYNVSDKTKSAIWANEYIDFCKLQPNYHDEGEVVQVVSSSGSEIKIQTQTKVHQWCNSFDTYMSIYLSKHTDLETTLALIKYGNNIRSMSFNFGFAAAKLYDEEFRKLRVRAQNALQWAVVHNELWRHSKSNLRVGLSVVLIGILLLLDWGLTSL